MNNIDDISEIHLGNPYKRYFAHSYSISSTTDLSDLAQYANFAGYGFPILYKNIYIGTIKVAYLNDSLAKAYNLKIGSYIMGGYQTANQIHDEWIVNAQNKITIENEEVSTLEILFGFGRYIILTNKGKIIEMAPTLPSSAEIFSVQNKEDGSSSFVSIKEAEPIIKQMIGISNNKFLNQ